MDVATIKSASILVDAAVSAQEHCAFPALTPTSQESHYKTVFGFLEA